MAERTFGRTVRSQRTKLGLSQAKLGELVGRSATTVRSWERDQSHPTDAQVITALSAILGVDEATMFEKAGQALPVVEDSPTVEQALATLDPDMVIELRDHAESPVEPALPIDEPDALSEEPVALIEEPDSPGELLEDQPLDDGQPEILQPAYAAPSESYLVTTAIPPAHEPSYMEDRTQRQLYRVRYLATVVVLVSLGIALLWAMTQSFDALGAWWDEFFANLRL